MLIDQDAVLRAVEFVDDTMFYAERHRRLFRAMVGIAERGGVVDPLTLSDELQRRGDLEGSGGKDYIGFLVDAVPTAANIEYHAQIVREKSILRRLIEVSTSIVAEAFDGHVTARQLLDDAESKIFQVAQQQTREGFTRLKELLWPTMERIERLHAGGTTVTGVASGFGDLDEITSGFQPSDLIIVAARPSMGKTAFTLNVAQYAAIEHKVPVALFSLEMSKESLVQRMLTSEARIDAQRLRKGLLRDDDFPRLARAAGILGTAPVWIDDTPGITLLEMRSKARRLKTESGIGLVIVDYLQLMQGPSHAESRQQEVSQISRGLKALAKELNVPVIALSQLLARAGATHRRQQASAALRPARVGRDRTGRRPDHVSVSAGVLRRPHRQGRELARRQSRGHHRQATQRSDRRCESLLPQAVHALRELFAAELVVARPHSAPRSPRVAPVLRCTTWYYTDFRGQSGFRGEMPL